MYRSRAFTVAELLIALAVLGVIAAFAIPKVLSSQEEGRKIAVMKDNISHSSALALQAARFGGAVNTTQVKNYFYDHWNAIRVCRNSDTITEGCRQQPLMWDTYDIAANGIGAAMADGSTTLAVNNGVCPNDMIDIVVDYNGDGPPNLLGQDAVLVHMKVTGNTGCDPLQLGRFYGWGWDGYPNQWGQNNWDLWESLWAG